MPLQVDTLKAKIFKASNDIVALGNATGNKSPLPTSLQEKLDKLQIDASASEAAKLATSGSTTLTGALPSASLSVMPGATLKLPISGSLADMSISDIPKLMEVELPFLSEQGATLLATAYHEWVLSSSPKMGTLSLDPGVVTSAGLPALVSCLRAFPLLLGWGPGLMAYWGVSNWVGPGFIPINPIDPTSLGLPFGVAESVAKWIADSQEAPPDSVEQASQRQAKFLFDYTMKLRAITTTIPPTVVVAIVPIS